MSLPKIASQQLLAYKVLDSEYREFSPHPEDRPAPLFSGKSRVESTEQGLPSSPPADPFQGHIGEPGPIQEIELAEAPPESEEDYLPYEVDIDGTPVVGDLLKIKFVEHKVVPTILVSFFLPTMLRLAHVLGFFFSIPLE